MNFASQQVGGRQLKPVYFIRILTVESKVGGRIFGYFAQVLMRLKSIHEKAAVAIALLPFVTRFKALVGLAQPIHPSCIDAVFASRLVLTGKLDQDLEVSIRFAFMPEVQDHWSCVAGRGALPFKFAAQAALIRPDEGCVAITVDDQFLSRQQNPLPAKFAAFPRYTGILQRLRCGRKADAQRHLFQHHCKSNALAFLDDASMSRSSLLPGRPDQTSSQCQHTSGVKL